MQDAFWVFAYGSLMWRPGFPVAETQPAIVYGYHRAMCIWSTHYRGTTEKPGLVLGLDRGGSCHGLALRVAKTRVKTVVAYLLERELMGGDVYLPRMLNAVFRDDRREPVYAFVANHAHSTYAGHLRESRAASFIRVAEGTNGTNRAYLANTVEHIDAMGLADDNLRHLLKAVDKSGRSAR
ncbi:MAG TPA: gamma-glutamylcyclotransferase [Magnetospirillaceae bacterium]|jgi:cation transport protein ChaC